MIPEQLRPSTNSNEIAAYMVINHIMKRDAGGLGIYDYPLFMHFVTEMVAIVGNRITSMDGFVHADLYRPQHHSLKKALILSSDVTKKWLDARRNGDGIDVKNISTRVSEDDAYLLRYIIEIYAALARVKVNLPMSAPELVPLTPKRVGAKLIEMVRREFSLHENTYIDRESRAAHLLFELLSEIMEIVSENQADYALSIVENAEDQKAVRAANNERFAELNETILSLVKKTNAYQEYAQFISQIHYLKNADGIEKSGEVVFTELDDETVLEYIAEIAQFLEEYQRVQAGIAETIQAYGEDGELISEPTPTE